MIASAACSQARALAEQQMVKHETVDASDASEAVAAFEPLLVAGMSGARACDWPADSYTAQTRRQHPQGFPPRRSPAAR